MTSLIKTFKNHKLYHEYINLTPNKHLKKTKKIDVIFTKVLTKYSTEYNNSIFIQKMCQMLGMDKRDMFSFFIELISFNDTNKIINILEEYDISKLDVNRIYRYIEKYTKENASGISDNDIEEYENEDLLDE